MFVEVRNKPSLLNIKPSYGKIIWTCVWLIIAIVPFLYILFYQVKYTWLTWNLFYPQQNLCCKRRPVSFRTCMNGVCLIRDRKYRLRTYRSCFQGNETVDWMVRSRRCDDRLTAVRIMRTLQKWSFFHHGKFLNLVYCKILTICKCLDSLCQFPSPFSTVCDDHNFKDELLFYRFRRDDDSIESQKDLLLFYKVLDIYHS